MILGSTTFMILALIAAISGKPAYNKKYYKKAVTPPPRGPGCGGKQADVFFLLDASTSIWSVDFAKQTKFVSNLVDSFNIGPDATRIGVATFSSGYYPQFGMTRYQEKGQLKEAIEGISQRGGNTHTGTALQHMRMREFAPGKVREGVSKIAIVMTDGKSRNHTKTVEQAELAKLDNIHIFAFGIGDKCNYTELENIGSKPSEKFVFRVANFDALEKLKVELALGNCEEEPVPMVQNDQPVCSRDTLADVMFVFDSFDLGAWKTEKIQEYIGNVVDEFNFDDDVMRAGVVSRNCHDGDIELGKHSDKDDFAKDLRNRDIPELSHVIQRMRSQSFTVEQGARLESKHIAVIFVDDKLQVPKRVFSEIEMAKDNNIEIYVVAIGEVDMTEVEAMATSPDHVIPIPDYDVMKDTSSYFVEILCTGL